MTTTAVTTTTHEADRRTYTRSTDERAAQRAALRLARAGQPGWEHHAGLVTYITAETHITRLSKSDEGRTVRERRIPR